MKILIVNTFDIEGGAARAAFRLHQSLITNGINSNMLVMKKSSDVISVLDPIGKIQKGLAALRPTLDGLPVNKYKNRDRLLFSPAWLPFSGVVDRINKINPDLVHLHWVANGMLRIEDIAKIKSPIVWSLHDDWAFTGGCHIKWECERYQKSCGFCPRLGSSKENDLSSAIYKRKSKVFGKIPPITVIGLSNWLADCARKASLFKGHKVVSLPNPIDTSLYAPYDKIQARNLLNLPQDKKLVAFGAMSATSDINKGFKELTQALSHIENQNVELLIFGASQPEVDPGFIQKAHYLGRLHDDATLRALYSAADVMVVPSLQEAFGQTASEAMACGTPVAAFGATGLLDIVDHKVNGYLAKAYDTLDLAVGIDWVLAHSTPQELSHAARDKVTATFESKLVANQYIELYKGILDK